MISFLRSTKYFPSLTSLKSSSNKSNTSLQTSKFLKMRNQIKKGIKFLGFRSIDVKSLNIMTKLCLNPAMFALINVPIRIVKSLKLNTILK